MTTLAILLTIWALIATAMAATYWRAWKDMLDAFDYVVEDEHRWLDDIPTGEFPAL